MLLKSHDEHQPQLMTINHIVESYNKNLTPSQQSAPGQLTITPSAAQQCFQSQQPTATVNSDICC